MKLKHLNLILISLSLLLVSCSKGSLEDKVIGNWKQISVGHLPEGSTVVWTFNSDHKLFRVQTIDTIAVSDTGTWSVDNKFAQKNTLTIEGIEDRYDGLHSINQLDQYLRMQRVEFPDGHTDGSFLWSEFEKQ